MLHSVYLFKDVKITPDYSVVHDLTPDQWKTYLIGDANNPSHGDIVYQQSLNYYRLPDVIRIEANYDEIRKVTYGMIDGTRNTDPTQLVIKESFERPMFFFVKDVRLIRQDSRTDKEEQTRPWVWDVKDVVELDIEVDVWSSNGGSFDLYDSYVERKHMPRWKNTGTEQNPVWEPVYYPNAAQGVEGAYHLEDDQDATGNILLQTQWGGIGGGTPEDTDVIMYFIQLNVLTDEGVMKTYVIPVCLAVSESYYWEMNVTSHSGNQTYGKFFKLNDLLDGTMLTWLNITADFIQSIIVYPVMADILDNVTVNMGGLAPSADIDDGAAGMLGLTFARDPADQTNLRYFYEVSNKPMDMRSGHKHQSSSVTPVKPDKTHVSQDPTLYDDEHEPMMYYGPARTRKVITSYGGEVFSIPDITAFSDIISTMGMSDIASGATFIFLGSDMIEANALGACGVMEGATLPIYNSAWRSYEAINKVGDEISFNAKQMQALANGTAGTASNAIMGGFVGNAAGAIMGAITGIVGTGAAMYGNAEELRAKQVTIRNSPCNVKGTGSGLTACIEGLVTLHYVTLKLDDVSMEKLRFMYYWFGYHVNRTIKGTVDLHTRSKFDYIKTSGAKVRGDLTAGAVRQISSIFDSGVTIYHGTAGYELIGTGDMKENDEI